jgi:hemerythrin-like domain-containing protein
MPVSLGTKPDSGFDDPFGLLSDCHRRIERFMGVLATLAIQFEGQRLTLDAAEAVTTVLRYFRDAAPKHTLDEEESLFPRVRARGCSKAQQVLLRVRELEQDHHDATAWHAELDRLGRRWVADGELGPDDFERLQDLVAMLQRLYHEHIEVEDHHVFPAAKSLLTREEIMEMGREMAHRRGLAFDGGTLNGSQS